MGNMGNIVICGKYKQYGNMGNIVFKGYKQPIHIRI